MKTVSMRGVEVDFARYIAQHENDIAIGNGKMNARGDVIGRGGVIVKRREAIAAQYNKANPKAVRTVSLKDIAGEVLPTPAEAMAQAMKEARESKPAAKPSPMMVEPKTIVNDLSAEEKPARKARKISDGE
jgi:hypothetical protein